MIYDFEKNEIFELDEEGFRVVSYLNGSMTQDDLAEALQVNEKEVGAFLNDLQDLGLIETKISKNPQVPALLERPPFPSLKTMLVNITTACNLNCAHCYLDKSAPSHVEPKLFKDLIRQFFDLQGLKVLISGGEPMVHPRFWDLLESIKAVRVRKILLSNGILMNEERAARLQGLVHEVQISIDGIKGHDAFRRQKGCFNKSIQAIKILKGLGLTVSVSTMIHGKNLTELNDLEALLKELDVDSWSLDVPSVTGSYLNNEEFHVDAMAAGALLNKFGWGEDYYETSKVHGCGAHLCAIDPEGNVSKCGFFEDQPVGSLRTASLKQLWMKIQKDYIWRQEELRCHDLRCPHLEECKGGCRYRAFLQDGDIKDVDRVRCASYGMNFNE